jgi:hypothetical protein
MIGWGGAGRRFGRVNGARCRRAAAFFVPVLVVAGCATPASAAVRPTELTANVGTAAPQWVNHDADNWGGWADPQNPGFATNPQGCDPIDPSQCMLPYPNDWFTRPDPTSATGRRLDLNVLAMPQNIEGQPIDPAAWNDSDGFSAGSQILTDVPGMTENSDLAASGLPTDLNMAANGDSDLGVTLIDATTGKVWPVWVEIDQYTTEAGLVTAGTVGPIQQDLMIHPAKNLLDGQRYIVALRHIRTDSGGLAQPNSTFESYVSSYVNPTSAARAGTGSKADPRTGHMDGIFEDLQEAGWTISTDPSDLYLAWDFTTASTQNVTGRLLAIRDNAFEQLGESKAQIDAGQDVGSAPKFTVSSVTDYQSTNPGAAGYNANIAREIKGTFVVPCYIAPTCSPPIKCDQISSSSPFDDCPSPGTFYYTDPADPDDDPSQVPGQTYQAAFICVVGQSAFNAKKKLRPVEYGHGLFGSYTEVTVSPQEEMANREGMMYCATDWFGWADSDIPNAILALSNLTDFPFLADRGQQGELNFLYLQRLMINPAGFASNPAFQYSPGDSFINLDDGVYYDGNSQGGIFGGTVCSVSIDARRCALGVVGMDFSVLLPRSVDYVADDALPQFLATNLEEFVANPTTYNAANLEGVGYSNVLDLFYPDQAQRQLLLDLIQTLWDRVDPDGYASHMTASAEGGLIPDCTGLGVIRAAAQARVCSVGAPDHHALLQVAWGDHQTANFTAFDEARTIGAESVGGPATSNVLGGGEAILSSRLCSNEPDGNAVNDSVDGNYCYAATSPLWGITPIAKYPYDGSAIAIFDAGPDGDGTAYSTDPPPPSDVPPPDNSTNQDPHEAPRRTCAAQDQKGAFFDLHGAVTGVDGYVTDPVQHLSDGGVLSGPPYFSGGWHDTCALP